MPNDTKIIHLGPGEGEAFSAAGDVYRVLASGRQTGGVYALSEIRVSPNNGPPPHIHSREDESFFVLEGEVEFQVGDEKITARPGTFIQGPRGIAHSFKNNTQRPARILGFVTPAGFENFFKEFARPVASFDSPAIPASKDEIDKLLAAAPKYGLQILPPNNETPHHLRD
jgi:quercetin dioxygenase-like cupin family protein